MKSIGKLSKYLRTKEEEKIKELDNGCSCVAGGQLDGISDAIKITECAMSMSWDDGMKFIMDSFTHGNELLRSYPPDKHASMYSYAYASGVDIVSKWISEFEEVWDFKAENYDKLKKEFQDYKDRYKYEHRFFNIF